MVSYFRVYDPIRVFFLLLLLIVIRLPVFLQPDLVTVPLLDWLLTGEKVSGGALFPEEAMIAIGPLSGYVYGLMDMMFGKSILAHHIISTMLVFIQAVLFNLVLNESDVYREKGFLPAFIYVVLSCLFFDFNFVSPHLLAVTFLILATQIFLGENKGINQSNNALLLGFYIAIACLFSYSAIFFLVFGVLAMVLLSGMGLLNTLRMLGGTIMIFILFGAGYSLFGDVSEVWRLFLFRFSKAGADFYPLLQLFRLLFIPVLFAFYSVVSNLLNSSLLNQQIYANYLFMIFLLTGLAGFFLAGDNAPYQLFFIIPAITHFIGLRIMLVRKKLVAELATGLLIGSILFVNIGYTKGWITPDETPPNSPYFLDHSQILEIPMDKTVMDLRNTPAQNIKNAAGSVFVDEAYARAILSDANTYAGITRTYLLLGKELPEYVIDQDSIFRNVLFRIPEIERKYELIEPNLYKLKD